MKKEEITKEEMREYIEENWDEHFGKCMVDVLKEFISDQNYHPADHLMSIMMSALSNGVHQFCEDHSD